MATLHLCASAGGLAACAFLLSGGGAPTHATGWGQRAAQRQLRALCRILGARMPAEGLMRLPSWRAARREVARRMRRHGLVMDQEEAAGLVVLFASAFVLALGLLSRSPVGAFAGCSVVFVALPVWESSRRRARERALIDEMPGVFRTLAMALGSGETLTQAIEYVGMHERGYAGEAFVNAALRLRCGASTEEAMDALGRELEAPGVGLLTTALVIAQRTGSPLRGLFQSSAQLVERQGEYERMLSVKTAQVRLSVRIVCLLPFLLVCLLSLISVDFQQGLATLPGMLSLLVATVMDAGALLAIRHLMRGVL